MIHQFSCPKKIDIKVDNDNNPWMKEIMKAFKKEEARMEKERQNETLPEVNIPLLINNQVGDSGDDFDDSDSDSGNKSDNTRYSIVNILILSQF
ncbi:uncharacterized protein OCT59_027599 [Rhizophagus irregularis]|uniref:uncharacterized protein n=1 Tax=Rhizophagus irregularis TaxID=588596 RepID=UPI0019E7260F|nr:hypothetical protein OCT59_027599 [Rhizophagus irregularis]GET52609.1 hypothetical protein GLOIN_2v1481118 [Rhizophagus irregularis DAOM 181602=DAOM 197198]